MPLPSETPQENPTWDALWQQDYAHTSADPAIHAAHQVEMAARVLQNPDQFDAAQVTWARAVFCS